jgi:hypothetical protein
MIYLRLLLIGSLTFAAAFIAHILIWRIVQPKRHILWLAVLFIGLPIVLYGIVYASGNTLPLFIGGGHYRRWIALSALFHTLLSGSYIMTYPAMQTGTLTLRIIVAVSAAMPRGLAQEEINDLFTQERVVSDLYDMLINDGLLVRQNGGVKVTKNGRAIAAVFTWYRKLLGLPLGEG